ncbi:MAG: polysaccharide biosynthesis protein [Holosporaceae bacterium]|jgi:hypothetical protein|nr:polysaccharide biosynthesis protein [Holosporaceae bacterium]
MLDFLLKKIIESVSLKKIREISREYCRKFREKWDAIPEEYAAHMRNILVLAGAYGFSSLLIYPEFKIYIFLKEIFSLLCAYGAIFCWFIDKIDNEMPFKVAVGVTACIAPVLFINNAIGVAIVSLLAIVFFEFVIFEYLRGCNLFSDLAPVYMICENEQEAERLKEFNVDYKILELIILSGSKNSKYSSLRSVEDIKKWMKKINYMPFHPSPRRFMYVAKKINPDNLAKLRELSAEYSVSLFKATPNVFNRQNVSSTALSISPISPSDFETIAIFPSDKTALSAAFKNKRAWICYDGRGSILDLICVTSLVSSMDLTVLCESERLMVEAEQELSQKCPNRNYKIKIFDINLLGLQGSTPDVLFYNIPVKSFHSGEENLKEAVAKNVLDTKRLVDFAQSSKIPCVFLMSSSGALNANNWVGATQRLGELYAQFADSQNRKNYTKFKIIRIPEEMTYQTGIGGKIVSSIFLNGYVNADFSDSELAAVYYRRDLLTPLLKTIISLMKNNDATSSVYTIAPKNEMNFDDVVKDVCNTFGLRKDKDVQMVYGCRSEAMKLDDFISISESLEKTAIANVLRTKFSCVAHDSYEHIWTIEEINNMTTRELISAVFQSLNQKIKT